jgi:hypothetical protein
VCLFTCINRVASRLGMFNDVIAKLNIVPLRKKGIMRERPESSLLFDVQDTLMPKAVPVPMERKKNELKSDIDMRSSTKNTGVLFCRLSELLPSDILNN